jgi:hypothetical protein
MAMPLSSWDLSASKAIGFSAAHVRFCTCGQ